MRKTKLSPKAQNLLGCGIAVGIVCIGITLYGSWSIYSFFSQIGSPREIPDEIKEARILKGEEFLAKTEFFKLTKENLLKTIGDGSQAESEKERQKIVQSQIAKGIYNFADLEIFGDKIIAVGNFGGYVFDLNGDLKREILFEPTKEKVKIGWYEQDNFRTNLDNLEIVELEKDKFGFVSFDVFSGVTVFDADGKKIWNYAREDFDLADVWSDEKEREKEYQKRTYVLEATVGDLDNDGVGEYIVARKKIGIEVFDRKGNKKWTQKDDFPSSELVVLDLDNDGKNELIQVGQKIFDGEGNLIQETKGVDSDAELSVDAEKKQETLLPICGIYEDKLTCVNEKNESFLRADAPLSEARSKNPQKVENHNPDHSYMDDAESIGKTEAVLVKLQNNKPKYLAVVGAFIGLPRANLYIYDLEGNLVYHELLPEEAETIAVLPKDNGTEEILIGGKDTIWRFTAK